MKLTVIIGACLAFIVGVWLASMTAVPAVYLLLAMILAILLSIITARRLKRWSWIFLLLAFLLAGGFRFMWAEKVADNDVSHYIGDGTVILQGVVDNVPSVIEESADRKFVRYTINAQHVGAVDGGERKAVSGQVVINVEQQNGQELLQYGSDIQAKGQLQNFNSFKNFGQSNWNNIMRRQGISARMNTHFEDIEIRSNGQVNAWKVVVASWRQRVKDIMLQVMPADDAALLNGMVFGGYGGIDRQVAKDFSATGLVHILSVSGSHIALLAGTIIWLTTRMGWRFGSSAILAAIAIVIYGAIAGWTPAVIRAVIMGVLTLLGAAFGRERSAASVLAATVLIMVFITPGVLFNLSFLLSASATVGLVAFYKPIYRALNRLPNWLSMILAATIAAQLGALPFLAWYFNTLSLSSIPANILVLPAIDIALIAALIAAILPGFLISVTKFLFVISSLAVSWVGNVAAVLSVLPYSILRIPTMNIAEVIIYYLLLLWWVGYLKLPRCDWRGYKRTAATVVIIIGYCAAIYAGNHLIARPMEVHFIDVGQGDATLVITPHRQAVLIDSGGVTRRGFDIGERVVVPYLLHQGIDDLTALILTHSHNDHAGGAAAIESAIDIDEIIIPQGMYNPRLQALVNNFGQEWVVPASDGQQFVIDGVTFSIVMDHSITAEDKNGRKENSRQAIVAVNYKQCGFLITGDLTAEGERALLRAGKLAKFDVLKVGHHGSASSSSAEFVATIQPQFAVISVGADNRYGHPSAETLNRLQIAGAEVLRTDDDGAIVMRSDGQKISVSTFVGEKGEK